MRVRLDLAYDGADFYGWAAQPERRTVAGVLTAALDRLFGAPATAGQAGAAGGYGLTVAGRTDAGAHAFGQVCHVDLPAEGWQRHGDTLLRRLAGMLPADVRVTAVTPVSQEFDARFSALRRRYRYRVSDAPYGVDPLRRRDTLAWPRPLDLDRLRAASGQLVGVHDFAAFCRCKENGTTTRTITQLDWHRDAEGGLIATVTADAFCQSMVRSLVGALLAVGAGQRPLQWPGELLARTTRASEVRVAPAHGLVLVRVDYPATPDQWAAQAHLTRRRRA